MKKRLLICAALTAILFSSNLTVKAEELKIMEIHSIKTIISNKKNSLEMKAKKNLMQL